jgi:transcriptional regulator with XRE-family HTH domain
MSARKKPAPPPPHNRSATAEDKAIGLKLRTRRMEQKMSQAELGDFLGVSFQQVQKYEQGVNRVGASRLAQIADVLDCGIDYFIEARRSHTPPSKIDEFMATREGVQIVEAMIAIESPKVRQRMIDLARVLGEAA